MLKVLYLLQIFCFINTICSVKDNLSLNKIMIDFKKAMDIKNPLYKEKLAKNFKSLTILENVYNKNHFSKLRYSNTPKIPKIIHQIWIGDKQLPKHTEILRNSWKVMHPTWQYYLWTNKEAEEFSKHFSPNLKNLFNNLKNGKLKSNILRYYILNLIGGLYVDIDFECLKPFDLLHNYYDLYLGIMPHTATAVLSNGIIGAIPNHPSIRSFISVLDRITNSGEIMIFSEYMINNLNKKGKIDIALPTNIFFCNPKKFNADFAFGKKYIVDEAMTITHWINNYA